MHDKAPGSNIAKTPRVQADSPNVAKGNSNLLVSNLHYEITPKDLTVRLIGLYVGSIQ